MAEVNAEIAGRFSVADLVEQTDEALDAADEMFYLAETAPEIVSHGTANFINWWLVRSSDVTYECRRFKNFVWCSCPAFFYKKRMCKHLARTAGVYCQRCRVLRAARGKYCHDCHGIVNRYK